MKKMYAMSSSLLHMSFLVGSVALTAACPPVENVADAGDNNPDADAGVVTDGGTDVPPEPVCSTPIDLPCLDATIQELNLQDGEPAPGLITNEVQGTDFVSVIDATAGGAFAATPDSYVYAKFTDEGLVKIEINDDDALSSMDWDISFRRFVMRINSGDSGPSCVGAVRVPGQVTYADVVAPPENFDALLRLDDFLTDNCELIPDGSGLPNAPATALSSYWTYPGCIAMSDNIYIVQRADGRMAKLIVEAFYDPIEAQEECDTTSSTTGRSAVMRVRWSFLN